MTEKERMNRTPLEMAEKKRANRRPPEMTEKIPMPPDFRYREVLRRGRPVHLPLDAFSVRHPAMPLSRRAKIFSPFDALKGFSEALTAQTTGSEIHDIIGHDNPARPAPGKIESRFEESIFEESRFDMCTRFYIDISDKELQEIVTAAENTALAEKFMRAGAPLSTAGEIRPTDVAAVIATTKAGHRAVFPMRWGFHITGLRDGNTVSMLLNARLETASQKRTFSESWREHRCVIPASCYYEWAHYTSPEGKKKIGQKYAIQPRGSAATWLGGLYRMEEGFPHFVVLTRPPGESIAFIHDRMPVILPKERIDDWINPKADPDQIIRHALDDVIYDSAG